MYLRQIVWVDVLFQLRIPGQFHLHPPHKCPVPLTTAKQIP
jgi:hypothetical protein